MRALAKSNFGEMGAEPKKIKNHWIKRTNSKRLIYYKQTTTCDCVSNEK